MQTAPPRPAPRWSPGPRAEWLALLAVGTLAAAGVAIWPAAPTSDAWLPYELHLRIAAAQPGRVALWWDRHAGYVTAPAASVELPGGPDVAEVRIPCPSGPIVRALLQVSPTATLVASEARILRDARVVATFSLAGARPLHGTCAVARPSGGPLLRIAPLTPDDMQVELLLQPALNLPVPDGALPPPLRASVARQRILGLAFATIGLLALGRLRGRDPAWTRRAAVRGAIASYAVLAIAYSRRPDVLALPQCWAEDGAVFLAEQQRLGIAALAEPYAGYLHLWPRVVAALGDMFPLHLVPVVYFVGACIALAIAACRVAMPRTPLPLAGWCALTLVLVPHMGELVLNLTNAQWFGAVALLAVALSRPPGSTLQQAGDVAVVLVFGLTGPFALLLLPLFLARAGRARTRSAWLLCAFIALAAGVQGAVHLHAIAAAAEAPANGGAAARENDALALLAVSGLRTAGEFFGLPGRLGANAPAWIGLALLVLWLAGWVTLTPRGSRFHHAMLAWAAAAILAGGLWRYRAYPDELFLPTHAQRYFHLPMVATIWLLLGNLRVATRWRRLASTTLLALLAVQLAAVFRIAPLVDFGWVEQTRAATLPLPVTIPINPAPWAVVLEAPD